MEMSANECDLLCDPANARRSQLTGPVSGKYVTEDCTGVGDQAPLLVNVTGNSTNEGSRGEADDSKQVPSVTRGKMNLRVRSINCQTTNACQTDSATFLSSTAEDVVQEASADNPAPTKAKSRARKKWTDDMNTFILRTYFILTTLETDTKSYLAELHKRFTEQFPEIEVSRQRIGDQRRAIINRKLLSTDKIDNIRKEAETILQHPINEPNSTQTTNTETRSQRMRWSNEINETIMRIYYKITNLNTNITAYRQPLHQTFIAQYPHLSHLSEQRIADQRRVIVNNKLIADERLEQIRDDVSRELDQPTSSQPTESRITRDNTKSLAPISQNYPNEAQCSTQNLNEIALTRGSHTNTQQSDLITTEENIENRTQIQTPNLSQEQMANLPQEHQSQIEEAYTKTLENFKTTDPISRPSLPRQKTSKKFAAIVHFINTNILPKHITEESSFEDTQTAIYCAAYTAVTRNGGKVRESIGTTQTRNRTPNTKTPMWQKRLMKRIQDIRANIGRLSEFINGNRSERLKKTVDEIKTRYKIHSQHEGENTELSHFLDTLKQKLSALASRLRRYKLTTKRKSQNAKFNNNEKLFYRSLNEEQNNNTPTESPEPETLKEFWSNIWSVPKEHAESQWIKQDKQTLHNIPDMEFDTINLDTLKLVIGKLHNWKATGSDNIHNFWYKKFTYLHHIILNHINNFIKSPETMPEYVTLGTTYMLPKDKSDMKNPAKYRPITCLQNIYKIITSCISEIIYRHTNSNSILAEQQKGCRRHSQGCKEQLTVDAVVSKQALVKSRNIYTMYIDYKKAFDSVPHTWLLYILEHYKIHPIIVQFLGNTMNKWKTVLKLKLGETQLQTESIAIRRGIFQGDSLSPLWFCLALNPLSNLLNNSNKGFKIKFRTTHCTLSHLMYMDDIKLFGTNLKEIEHLADITQTFSSDIHMEFGIDKCKTLSVRRGKVEENSFQLNTEETIEPVDVESGYKYLGYQQTRQIHQKQTRAAIEQKFISRLHKILNTHLNAKNTIKAINTYAIPILTYSFGIIHWSKSNLIKLQRMINTHMTKYRKHHPRACSERLTLPNIEGGRGLIDVQNLHNTQITTLRKFFHLKAQNSLLHDATVQADTKFTPLNLNNLTTQKNENITSVSQKLNSWLQKSLHGRHRRDLMDPNVDKIASNAWLKSGELFPETEGFMLAIQDQIIDTRNYRKHIIRDNTLQTDLCRHCHSNSETIQHITGACRSIAQTDYKHRHDQVAAIIHQYLAIKYKLIKDKTSYYKYKPEIILESINYKLYWDRTIITDKTVHFNRPDITLHDKNNKIVYLIDIAIPNTHNLSATHTEKITKYTDLAIELKTQWKVDTVKTVPVVLSTTGVIPYTLHTSLETLNIHKLTYLQLQKATILNTCRIVRKFLSLNQ